MEAVHIKGSDIEDIKISMDISIGDMGMYEKRKQAVK